MRGPGLYDPTTIVNMDIIRSCQVEGWVKVVFYILAFIYFAYRYLDSRFKQLMCTAGKNYLFKTIQLLQVVKRIKSHDDAHEARG